MAPSGSSDPRVTWQMSLIGGSGAGAIESFVTYPFEFAKTRVQLRASKGLETSQNPFRVVGSVIRNEGFRSLYLGCSTMIIGTMLKDGIRFLSFDTIKRQFADAEGRLSPMRSLGAGIASGIAASTFAVTPTERIKTALIDDARETAAAGRPRGERQFRGAYHAAREILRTQGFYGIYRGYLSTTLKQAGTTSVRMGTYNILKEFTTKHDIAQNAVTSFGNGAVAGIVTTYTTQPIDTVKSRCQNAKGMGIVDSFKSVIEDYGVRGLWRGSTMRLGRTVLAGGILFTAYEQIIAVLIPIMGKDVNAEHNSAVQ